MASADELIREAQYAFRNISHGSTDESKYRARAKKYAKRIIRTFPTSMEASQARRILRQLDEYVDIAPPPLAAPTESKAATEFMQDHASNSGHTANAPNTPDASDTRFQNAALSEDWRNVLRRFMRLPSAKKQFLGFILAIAIFFPGAIFATSGLVIFYALQPALLKKHLDQLLTKLGSE